MSKVYVLTEVKTDMIQLLAGREHGLLAVYDTTLNAEAAIPQRDKQRLQVVEAGLIGPTTILELHLALETLKLMADRLDKVEPLPPDIRRRVDSATKDLMEKLT